MWGILPVNGLISEATGITPTHVGNTLNDDVDAIVGEDHPHTCGEYQSH